MGTCTTSNNKNEYMEIKKENIMLKEIIQNLKEPNLVGLVNIGAQCYMNATLQSLYNTKKFTDYFLEKYHEGNNKIMSNEYYTIVKNLSNRNNHNKSYAPHSFKQVLIRENPVFEGVYTNESKDLISYLLERFHEELNIINENNLQNNLLITQQDQLDEQKMLYLFIKDFKAKFNSIISNLFYGVMETKSLCHGCNCIKYTFQVYSFLEFHLESVNKYCFTKGLRNNFNSSNNNPDIDLYEFFNHYSNIDLMNGENQMYCNICKKIVMLNIKQSYILYLII